MIDLPCEQPRGGVNFAPPSFHLDRDVFLRVPKV
jgi:hypothetical protein